MLTVRIDDTTPNHERSGAGPAMLFVHGTFGDTDVRADQVVTVFAAELGRRIPPPPDDWSTS